MTMVLDDGGKPITSSEFASRLLGKPLIEHPLEQRLVSSRDHLARQLAFVAPRKQYLEIQALGCKIGRGEVARAIHIESTDEAIRACAEADSWSPDGIYLMPADLKDGAETKHSVPGKWFDIPKGEGTKDTDIQHRLIIAIDFDIKRPSGTSATDEEMAKSISVALRAWGYLEGALDGDQALAYVHSGNGRQIHVALDALPNDEETKRFLSGILIGFASIFDIPDVVLVDQKLFDAKRLLPACGTLKRKGARGIKDRPHRMTAIVTPEEPRRLQLDEVKALARHLWEDTDENGRSAMAKAIGVQHAPTVAPLQPSAGSPFADANAVPPLEVASWLGVFDGTVATCPGCGEQKGVAVINHGLKCSHNRCQGRGRNGFRTNVDLVAEMRSCSPREAVNLLAERFGFRGLRSEEAPPPPAADASGFRWISTAEIFEPLPPTNWLVPELQLVAGRPTMLAGYGFSGKTLMAQALALALAAGVSVWGRFAPPSSFLVRHLDYEQGRHATLKRYQRIAAGQHIAREILGDRLQVAVFPEVYLDSAGAQDAYARAFDGVAFGVLDALRGATPTLDENDSTIRRCIDNLSRVSEKTGTAFLILHHAGKNGSADGDQRKAPRGSSAIFDACGCVFAVEGEDKKPKKVQQTKAPAEAEGGSIAEFFLAIEDVAVGGSPTGGLLVRYCSSSEARPSTGQSARFDALKGTIIELVACTPGLKSANAICERVVGGNKSSKLTAIEELIGEGRIRQPAGPGTSFVLIGGGGTGMVLPQNTSHAQPVRTGPTDDGTGPGGPPPLRGTGTVGPHGPPPPGTGDRTARAERDRAAQAEKDAGELVGIPPKERKAYMAERGWGASRREAARALAVKRDRPRDPPAPEAPTPEDPSRTRIKAAPSAEEVDADHLLQLIESGMDLTQVERLAGRAMGIDLACVNQLLKRLVGDGRLLEKNGRFSKS